MRAALIEELKKPYKADESPKPKKMIRPPTSRKDEPTQPP
jgi:hypothetical protein